MNPTTLITPERILSPASNPAAFGKHIYNLTPADHHWRWLMAALDPRIRNLLIIAPRESAKTTWMVELLMPWVIGNNPVTSNFIGSVSDTQATTRMKAIKTMIEESPGWRECFPTIVPDYDRGWSTDGLFVKDTRYPYPLWIEHVSKHGSMKMPTLNAGGTGASNVVGGRYNGIVTIDDPHDEKNSHTELQRDRVHQWLMQTVKPTIQPAGKFIIITTRWNRDDVAGRLMLNRMWHTIEVPAIDARGRSYWEAQWSLQRLEDERATIGERYFRAMYLNDPQGLSGHIFDATWFQHLPQPLPHFVLIAIGVDLAISQRETADYTVIATIALDEAGNLYILDIDRERRTFHDSMAQIDYKAVVALNRWGRLDRVGIENTAYQAAAVQEMIRTTQHPVVAINPDGDKVQRARAWETRAQQGMVFADKHAPWYNLFIDEAIDFPEGKHDDQIDAISTAFKSIGAMNDSVMRQMRVKW